MTGWIAEVERTFVDSVETNGSGHVENEYGNTHRLAFLGGLLVLGVFMEERFFDS